MMARHFHTMQGLRGVAFALWLQSIAEIWMVTRGSRWTLLGGAASFGVLLIVLGPLLGRYYRSYGRVIIKPRENRLVPWVGPALASLLNVGPAQLPDLALMLASILPAWLAWDCRPYRWHWLLAAAAMVYVAFGRVGDYDMWTIAWMAPRFWALSGALAVCGLADHILFVRTMGATRAVAAEAS
jgi:hypothetical protein